MAHDVFISYSNKDIHVAKKLCGWLEDNGISCWAAWKDIPPGGDWAESIAVAIPKSKVFILIFSGYANKSKQVKREVEMAINTDVALIPMRIEDIMPTGSMSYYLATMNWIDALDNRIENKASIIKNRINALLDATVDTKPEQQIGAKKTSGVKKPTRKKLSKKALISIICAAAVVIAAGLALFLLRDALFGSEKFDPNMVVEIEDENLEAGIIATLQNMGETIGEELTVADMSKLGYLKIASIEETQVLDQRYLDEEELDGIMAVIISNDDPIESLEGMQFAVNLKEIMIAGKGVRDLSPLKSITSLERIDFTNNKVSNISGLENLKSLRELVLHNNLIIDLTPLENLTNITDLGLNDNLITNIEPLKKLVNLNGIVLMNNDITDISALKDMRYLSGIGLDGNNLEDISVLASMRKAQWLFLRDNNISDLSPLSDLAELKYLHLSNNNISDISPLKNLPSLLYLNIVGNPVETLEVLAEGDHSLIDIAIDQDLYDSLTSEVINKFVDKGININIASGEGEEHTEQQESQENDMAHNPEDFGWDPETEVKINDNVLVEAVAASLQAKGINVEDGITIAEMFGLETLVITTSHAEEVEAMGGVEGYMHSYSYHKFINNGNITNLNGLEYARNLKYLVIIEQDLEDITHLEELTALEVVSLAGNNISDTHSLYGKPNLKYVDLSYNPILSIASLEHAQDSLEYLSISYCTNINEINVLSVCNKLKVLDLTEITADISVLENLALEEFYISQSVYDNNSVTVEKLRANGCNVYVDEQKVN